MYIIETQFVLIFTLKSSIREDTASYILEFNQGSLLAN